MSWKLIGAIKYLALILIFLSLMSDGHTETQIEEIIKTNIEAAGGREKIQALKNFSFRAGTNQYYVLPDGTMKVLISMKDPVIIAALLITNSIVKENALHDIRIIEGTEKSRLQCLARLASGLFTFAAFKDGLLYQGEQRFGPERYYVVTTRVYDLNVTFFVDVEDFMIKRMTLKTFSPKEGHFDFIYEFGPPMEVMGCHIPRYIFGAPVGIQTSENPEPQTISQVRFNSALGEHVFTDIEVNMGEVFIGPCHLMGNVLDFIFFPQRTPFIIVTNWKSQDVIKAGLKTQDQLILNLDGIEIGLTLNIPESENDYINYSTPDARIMSMNPLRGNLYYIYFNLEDINEAEKIKSKLTPLLPIQVKKRTDPSPAY